MWKGSPFLIIFLGTLKVYVLERTPSQCAALTYTNFDFFSLHHHNGETEEHTSKLEKYEGPDHDFATMLERDVLEDTPKVKFDDVAGNEASCGY
ncbi:hypothetical protein Tco_1526490, partial [Tanacetum coccineum]